MFINIHRKTVYKLYSSIAITKRKGIWGMQTIPNVEQQQQPIPNNNKNDGEATAVRLDVFGSSTVVRATVEPHMSSPSKLYQLIKLFS